MGKYGLGGLCLGLGATILLGSVRDWWPSMPDLASYYLTVAGFELVAIGLFCLVAGFTEHRSGVAYDLYNRLINVLQSLWNGAFIPASAFAIFVVIPLTIDEVHSSGKYVYVLFEYPSLVDYSSDTYSVNYLITNDTDSPITLSDFKLLNISTNSKIYDPYHGFALCSDKKVTQFKGIDEEFNPHSAPPAGIEGVEFDAKVPKAAKLMVDGADITSLMAIVGPHKASVVAANFVTDKHDYIKWNTTVACPMVKIFFPKIGRKEVLCSGVLMIKFPETQYRDRISQLNYGEYRNPTLATGPGGLGTIFSLDDHMRRVTNDSSENHCHRYTQ